MSGCSIFCPILQGADFEEDDSEEILDILDLSELVSDDGDN